MEFSKNDAGKIQNELKAVGIPVKTVTVDGAGARVELENFATDVDKEKLKSKMKELGWL